ncbi:hypothetical protein DDE19_20145 [Micromonospora ureilytica]|uniref:Insertion element IS402-like domain-containing protein n=1 Tax=Micromonospora ureilytica TaxID=709868 RepID=A0A3N9XRK0_9ACTN|nr:hypothetical protein DDE19_20145 [Micromonospora ureilytica]
MGLVEDGRREKHPRREIVKAISHVARSGCPWRHLTADLPPWRRCAGTPPGGSKPA